MTSERRQLAQILAELRQLIATHEPAARERNACHFGRSPKIVVFLSVSTGTTRAACATGVGNTLNTAWRAALTKLRKCLPDMDAWTWIKADIVDEIRPVAPAEILAELNETRRNYFRKGIAFDANFNTALLEQELNGIAAWVEDENGKLVLSFERINRYLKCGRRGSLLRAGVGSSPEWYLFRTSGYFSDRSGPPLSLSREGYGQGLRRPALLADEIESLIENAGLYLARQMKDDGSFTYGYFPTSDTIIPTYNILRHAGTLYSMLEAWEATGNLDIARSVPRGIEFVLRTAVERHGNQFFVIDHANHSEVKLGAQAVFILTLLKYITVTGDKRYLSIAQALARGIVERFQDGVSGAFRHVLDRNTLEVTHAFRIVFYDGEAVLALIRLYEIDGEPLWIDSARKAFEHFISVDHWKHHDHWLAYCANEITRHFPEEDYFAFGLKNAFGNLAFIRKRETAYPTFLELLMASLLLVDTLVTARSPLLQKYDVRALVEAIDHRASHQRHAYLYPEMAMYFKSPGKIRNSFFSRHHAFRIRIDDVEHFISGYCLYLHNVVRVRGSHGA